MKRCMICGREEYLPFTCKFCGDVFCAEHRLPEKHHCPGLAGLKDMSKGIIYSPTPGGTKIAQKRRPRIPLPSLPIYSYSQAILMMCVVSFFLQIFPLYNEMFALYPTHVIARPWTLVTYIFLHGSFAHLLFNMLFLFFFGPRLESLVGSKTFLEIYLGSGVIAGIGHVLTSSSPVVGASGALYGIFGCLAIIAPYIIVFVYFIPMKITHAVILFAIMDFLLMGSGDMIAHAAHLSGLLVGIVYGIKLKRSLRRTPYLGF